MAMDDDAIPIIDSHIHLYPASELSTLAWCSPGNPIGKQHSVDDYVSAVNSADTNLSGTELLKGFIFLETDRKNDLQAGVKDGSGWDFPLMEVDWLRRIALGQPRAGEGHDASQKDLCLAIIPWAPLPSSVEALERYVELVKEHAGESWGKIRGFRYLIQYKPQGTCLTDEFIAGLKWLGKHGFVFDLGIDNHRDGEWALQDCLEMMTRAHEGVAEDEKVTFILNHLCKPDMTLFSTSPSANGGAVTSNPHFIAWKDAVTALSKFSHTYMKLSGCFSEIPAECHDTPANELYEAIEPWLRAVVAAFGPARIMFGSDWPVCTIGAADNAWRKWRAIVAQMLASELVFPDGLPTREEQVLVWGGTAIKAYEIKELM